MGLRYVTREWMTPGGYDGRSWSANQVTRFEKLMAEHSMQWDGRRWIKPVKGEPALVSSWDDGRMHYCWYSARSCPQERELLAKCIEIFGCRPQRPVD